MALRETVARSFLKQQWSPEQISNRLKYENSEFKIGYSTIHRAIYLGLFDTPEQRPEARSGNQT